MVMVYYREATQLKNQQRKKLHSLGVQEKLGKSFQLLHPSRVTWTALNSPNNNVWWVSNIFNSSKPCVQGFYCSLVMQAQSIHMTDLGYSGCSPSRGQNDTAWPKIPGKEKEAFTISHIVSINYSQGWGPTYTNTLFSGRIFQGLRGFSHELLCEIRVLATKQGLFQDIWNQKKHEGALPFPWFPPMKKWQT